MTERELKQVREDIEGLKERERLRIQSAQESWKSGEVRAVVKERASTSPSGPSGATTAADRARFALNMRLANRRAEYEDYRRHHDMRAREEDLHGMWDCAINMAEVRAAIVELEFALKVVEG